MFFLTRSVDEDICTQFMFFFLTRSVDEDICTQFRTKVQHGADCGQLQDSFQPTMYSRAWRRVQLLVYLYFICICLYSVTKIV